MDGWKKKRQVMRDYDATASSYDAQYMEEQEAKINTALQHLNLEKDCVVLDLGCGTGLLFEHVTKDTKLLVGLDFSKELLKQAKNRLKNVFNIALVRADADNVPFRDQIFNYVFAVTLLQNIPAPQKTVEEIRRVTKPHAKNVLTFLKEKFTQKDFVKLLRQTSFSCLTLMEIQSKDYIVVCQKKSIRKSASISPLTTY
jgi:ubiquinone/menaquinone biosynthesis C-methylase UbiE